MQRSGVTRFAAQSALKLKLVNAGQKISHVRHVCRHMIFGARIKIRFGPLHRRRHTLVFADKLPPRFIVFVRLHLAGENFPAPFVDQQSKRQKGDFF